MAAQRENVIGFIPYRDFPLKEREVKRQIIAQEGRVSNEALQVLPNSFDERRSLEHLEANPGHLFHLCGDGSLWIDQTVEAILFFPATELDSSDLDNSVLSRTQACGLYVNCDEILPTRPKLL